MEFNEIDQVVQNEIIELLNSHISTSVPIIEEDKCLDPMLLIKGNSPESNQLISLQAADGNTDVDRAFNYVVNKLSTLDFNYALFSYSTRIGNSSGKVTEALKTCIFNKSGLTVVFFTPYTLKGLFKKKVNIEQTVLFELIENIFE